MKVVGKSKGPESLGSGPIECSYGEALEGPQGSHQTEVWVLAPPHPSWVPYGDPCGPSLTSVQHWMVWVFWYTRSSYRAMALVNSSSNSSMISGVGMELYRERARYQAGRHQGCAWALSLEETPTTNSAAQIMPRGASTKTSSQGSNKMTPSGLRVHE